MSKQNKQASSPPQNLSIWEKIIEFIFHFLVVATPLFFLSVNEELFEFNKMLLVYAGAIVIATVWGIRMIWEKKVIWQRTPFDIPVALYLISQLISTFLSIHPRTSWMGYYTRFHGGLWSTLTYLTLGYAFIANVTRRKQHERFLWSTLLGALLAALYAIPEHFGHSFSCQFIAGQFTVECWVQDVKTRIFGTFGQPNWLAAYAITLLPFFTGWFLTRWKDKVLASRLQLPFVAHKRLFGWQQLSIAVTVLALLWSLLFTRSRSGFLGFGLGISVFIGLFIILLIKKTALHSVFLSKKLSFGLIITATVASLAWFGTPFTPALNQIATTPLTPETSQQSPQIVEDRLETGGTSSGEIRKIVWQGAIDIWKHYPIFGTGLETFAYSYYNFRPMAHNLVSEWDFLYNKAHNEVLNILANSGAMGLLTYALLQLSFFWWLIKSLFSQQDSQETGLQLGLIAGLIALHVSNFFGFSTVMVSLLMFLLPAYLYRRQLTNVAVMNSELDEVKKTNGFSPWQIIGALGVAIIGLYALTQVLMVWLADKQYAQAKLYLQSGDLANAASAINQSIQLSPSEAIFYELKSKIMSQAALSLVQKNKVDDANIYATEAFDASDTSLKLNPVHLNLYRSRVQMLLTLAQVEPSLYAEAKKTAEVAMKLAPTDAKLVYTIGIIESYLQEYDQAIQTLEKTVEMKTNYEAARFALAQLYEEKARYADAKNQYQYILDHIAPNNEQAKEKVAELATRSGEKK